MPNKRPGKHSGLGMRTAYDPTPRFAKEVRKLLPYEAWDLRKEVPEPKKRKVRKQPEPWEFTEDNKEGE